MLFNSIDFAVFLPLTFLAYWLLQRQLKVQNAFILLVSYFFYGYWDARFLILIFLSTILDYSIGRSLARTDHQPHRRALLAASLIFNLGMLGFFKYYNFFVENFVAAFSLLGQPLSVRTLNVILPVGISFYTFQTLSYTIDVYRRKLTPTTDFIAFSAFVSFFPQLVAGPIERASQLLPQFDTPRRFEYHQAVRGLRQILWGLFKKVVIADNCAHYVDLIFQDPTAYNGSTLALGAILFAFQIYGDFSGYSDIAIGTARLFGFRLMQNFAFPYFSRDIAEFWRRWHISLSTWFRDYLYIPLGGSRGSLALKVRNTFVIFLVSGFWHGANWTFIVWGALNALYFLPLLLARRNRQNLDIVAHDRALPTFGESLQILITFGLTVIAWVFFRAENVGHALTYLRAMMRPDLLAPPHYFDYQQLMTLGWLAGFLLLEWLGRRDTFALESVAHRWPTPLRWGLYLGLALAVCAYFGKAASFIYFQF